MSTHGAHIALDAKALTEEGEFAGYAAVFGNVDAGRDIIVPGAFDASLKARPAARVKLLRQHDQNDPIGVVVSLTSDSYGLKAKGRIITETVRGRETLVLMRAGALDAMSIGYRAVRDRWDGAKGARVLERIDLFEVSVVTFGMNPKAGISAVKGDGRARALVAAIERAHAALRAT